MDIDGNEQTLTYNAYAFRSLDNLKKLVDNAIINGSWLHLCTHLRTDSGGGFYCDETSRQLIIDLCKYAAEKGMLIQTFGEAFQRYKNITEQVDTIKRGQYVIQSNSHHVTDCNGVVHTKVATTQG
jgi:hypothetical protein